jgi:hypothetical protein
MHHYPVAAIGPNDTWRLLAGNMCHHDRGANNALRIGSGGDVGL